MESILRPEERLVRSLRALYSRFGYRPYRMSKFEEYDLYAGNRSFLPSGSTLRNAVSPSSKVLYL